MRSLLHRELTSTDLDLYEQYWQARARESFFAYRTYFHLNMKVGWWLKEVAQHFQRFYTDLLLGKRPKLMLLAPPQHGKTFTVEDFISWVVGINPKLKIIFTSYSDELGLRVNAYLQRSLESEKYINTFGGRLTRQRSAVAGFRNLSHLEFPGYGGSFRNTTVLGQITGQGLDLGIIDDPMKGRLEANSPNIRDKTWNWLTDDFFTRFSEHAGLLFTVTRWHLDDPAGRFLEKFPETIVLKYPAIAEEDEQYRRVGDALFPELKSSEFLLERKKMMTISSWLSLYQQSPITIGGGLFPIEQFKIVRAVPSLDQIRYTVRYWDKAGTHQGGKYTCGIKMHALRTGRFLIEDCRRGQLSALSREQMIKQTAELDGLDTSIYVEQEPGSGGKESAEATVRNLAGFTVAADRVVDAKHMRADPYAAQVQAGNVDILIGDWNKDFLNEHEQFPNGSFVDTVDAASGAFAKLTLGITYDSSLRWVM